MKTLEDKARFFAQYWGVKVAKKNIKGLEDFYSEPDGFIRTMDENSALYLELKPLSQISDEDAIDIAQRFFYEGKRKIDRGIFILQGKDIANVYGHKRLDIADFLRSRGYALPYLGISVEEQIELGWIKLKTI